jgi:hypothetical protein
LILVFQINQGKSQPTLIPLEENKALINAQTIQFDFLKHLIDPINLDARIITTVDRIIDLEAFYNEEVKNIISLQLSEDVIPSTNSYKFKCKVNRTNNTDPSFIYINYNDFSDHQNEVLFFIRRSTINLPFIEDFSKGGPYPNSEYWMDNFTFINNDFAINPPTLGIASFDGLDARGTPYGGAQGLSDIMTSMPINMASANPDRTYFSFYIQHGGYAFPPENRDSFYVDFKNVSGEWDRIFSISKNMINDIDSFAFYSLKVPNEYFHSNFQLRFGNYSGNNGITDVWNLDYIRLKEEFQTSNLQNELDLAFTEAPLSILEHYTHIPLKQLKGNVDNEIKTSIDIGINNLYTEILQEDTSNFRIYDIVSGSDLLAYETLLEVPPTTTENQRDVTPGRHNYTNAIRNTDELKNSLNNLLNSGVTHIKVEKQFAFGQTQESLEGTLNNNLCFSTTEIDQEFAYDDGTAESGIQLTYTSPGPKLRLALKFYANESDTIQALRLHLPHTRPENKSQRISFQIWADSDNLPYDEPIFTSGVIEPIFIDAGGSSPDSLQGFSTYHLKNENGNDTIIPIEPGPFYIGWTQENITDEGMVVGYDRRSKLGKDQAYYFNGDSWSKLIDQNSYFDGSIMFRPVLSGRKQVEMSSVNNLVLSKDVIHSFPNPVNDQINIQLKEELEIDLEDALIVIYDMQGKIIYKTPYNSTINCSELAPASYILAIVHQNLNRVYTTRFQKL